MESRLSEDLGVDSLDAIELIMSLEQEFAMEVSDDAAQGFKTINDIVKFVESKLEN